MGVAISACKVPGIRVSHFHQSLVRVGMGVLMTRPRSHTTRSLSRGWFSPTMVKSSH
jgi:hypothetical protein